MRSPAIPSTPAWHRAGLLRFAAAALVVALAMLACGQITPLTKAPAADLALDVTFANAYADPSGPIAMTVTVFKATGGATVLAGGQRLTCEGASDPNEEASKAWGTARFLVPRQAPGGEYTCSYTDERGQASQFAIPSLPPGRLALTAPVAGARVPIPAPVPTSTAATAVGNVAPSSLVVRYDFPTPPGYTVPAPDPHYVSIYPRFPGAAVQPFAAATVAVGCYSSPPCTDVYDGPQIASGVYQFSAADLSSSYGFAQVQPGAGFMVLSYDMHWPLATTVFAAVRISTDDHLTVPITWTASA